MEMDSAALLACRVCLATAARLYDIHSGRLAEAYALLMGTQVTEWDCLPQHVCSCCGVLLLKWLAFRERGLRAWALMREAQLTNEEITTNIVRLVDRTKNKLKLSLVKVKSQIIKCKPTEQETDNKDGTNEHSYGIKVNNIDIKVENIKDEITNNVPVLNFDNENVINKENNVKQIVIDDESEVKLEQLNDNNEIITEDADFIRQSDNDEISNPDPLITDDDNDDLNEIINEDFKNSSLNKTVKSPAVKDKINESKIKKNRKKKDITKNSNENEKCMVLSHKIGSKEEIAEFESRYSVDAIKLSKQEQIDEVQSRKDSNEYATAKFKCNKCYAVCLSEIGLKNHIAKHNPKVGHMKCDLCHIYFSSTAACLREHRMRHASKYVCRLCGHVTRARPQAREHYNNVHQSKDYTCQYCGLNLKSRPSYFNHIRDRHTSEHRQCAVCGEKFNGEQGLRCHMRRIHKEVVNKSNKCGVCLTQFHSAAALAAHACDTRLKACAMCGEGLPDEQALRAHQEERHRRDVRREEYRCDVCCKQYRTAANLRLHLSSRLHARTAGLPAPAPPPYDYKTYVCETCGKEYKGSAFYVHMQLHKGKKYIPKSGRAAGAGVAGRVYQCPHCPRTLKYLHNLNRHIRSHSGVRPHKCDLCESAFYEKDALGVHVKTVHMKMPYPPRKRAKRPAKRPAELDDYDVSS